MIQTSNLGFPRIGVNRELKKAVESYWKNETSQDSLLETAKQLRTQTFQLQQEAGIDFIPSNDFSFYDQVLDTAVMLGAIPPRYQFNGDTVDLDTYFAMARGNDDVTPMEMTKWFDTNYHYIVPEFHADQQFSIKSSKIFDEFLHAKELGITSRPVLLGPVSFLVLGKSKDAGCDPLDLIGNVLPVYIEIMSKLKELGADWIQIDEPVLVQDLSDKQIDVFKDTYKRLCGLDSRPKLFLNSYFGGIDDKIQWIAELAFEAIHVDLVRAPRQLETVLNHLPDSTILSMGVINGRNIWKAELLPVLCVVDKTAERLGKERVIVSPSCSMLHCPIDLDCEDELPTEIKERMSYAKQKLAELALVKDAVNNGWDSVKDQLEDNKAVFERAKSSDIINKPEVKARMKSLDDTCFTRQSPYPQRRDAQQLSLNLPLFPTTTIGSFPQTPDIRKTRAAFKKGTISEQDYKAYMRKQIDEVIAFQQGVGLDVLVHGEPERNDMVEYFGQLLDGFTFTKNGWVQSYGSRCVKPPVIYGDVARPKPMTVEWSVYSQSITSCPVKGMLTGPITILQWSFVREDQPRKDTAFQIALAIRDEVSDLEAAGIKVIQIDEPALKEGTPLKKSDWPGYFDWSVNAFRLATSSVMDQTQIHTHMCYCDFNDIMPHIAALDADVISIEASRSDGELLEAFADYNYPNEIGPGVYDIHSPRIPSIDEILHLLDKMALLIPQQQLWVNPDCGLKTRNWPETEQSLKNMVSAAIQMRNK